MTSSDAPTVSVCMSAYNTENYVATAIESALAQSLDDIEVIVLDNASTDRTPQVLADFDDPRLRILRVEENLGAAGGRSYALDHGRGRWLAVLDSDDWMAPERLARLVDLAARTGADVVADDVFLIDDGAADPWSTLFTLGYRGLDGETLIDTAAFVESDRWMKPGLRLGLTKPVFSRDFLEDHPSLRPNPNLTVVHDYWWVLEALLAGARFAVTPTAGYFYRAREGQLVTSGTTLTTLEQQVDMARDVIRRCETDGNLEVEAALRESLRSWNDALQYLRLLEAVRSFDLVAAARIARDHPAALGSLARRLPSGLARRVRRRPFTDHMTRHL